MTFVPDSWATSSSDSVHRSFFRQRLLDRAPPCEHFDPIQQYLIGQANLRGFFGAYVPDPGTLDPELGLEEIIVGLLMPHADADGRVLKLVLRIVQSGQVAVERLLLWARRERALGTLSWFVDLVPAEERNAAVEELARAIARRPPRDSRRPCYRYSPERLLRRR
ncbi:MAG: hypothetical protein HY791_19240 [Deltaproteobacteria bacterium]|nr:hypothetical protein [Deltaproteobacteria bacterium]